MKMQDAEWIVTVVFLGIGAFIFLSLLAAARAAAVRQAELERQELEKKRAREIARARANEVPEVVEAIGAGAP